MNESNTHDSPFDAGSDSHSQQNAADDDRSLPEGFDIRLAASVSDIENEIATRREGDYALELLAAADGWDRLDDGHKIAIYDLTKIGVATECSLPVMAAVMTGDVRVLEEWLKSDVRRSYRSDLNFINNLINHLNKTNQDDAQADGGDPDERER